MLVLAPLSISSAQAAAVKVGSYVGIWNAKTSYAAGDLITLNNKTFLSLVGRNLNKNPDTSPTSWQLLGGVGATGLQGPIGLTGGQGIPGKDGAPGINGKDAGTPTPCVQNDLTGAWIYGLIGGNLNSLVVQADGIASTKIKTHGLLDTNNIIISATQSSIIDIYNKTDIPFTISPACEVSGSFEVPYFENYAPNNICVGCVYKLPTTYYPSMGGINNVIRLSDRAFIPFALGNTDYQSYLDWLGQGNTPAPGDIAMGAIGYEVKNGAYIEFKGQMAPNKMNIELYTDFGVKFVDTTCNSFIPDTSAILPPAVTCSNVCDYYDPLLNITRRYDNGVISDYKSCSSANSPGGFSSPLPNPQTLIKK